MRSLLVLALVLFSSAVFASEGLVIHTAEFGVGKFHRYDNKQHAYTAGDAWAPFILDDKANDIQTMSQKNADGSYTIFFSSLEDMLKKVVDISNQEGKKVSVLNIHGHGLPGAMWFPKDGATLNSWACGEWKDAASGADVDNYNQYYSAVTVSEIQQIRDIAETPNVHMPCTTGLKEWQDVVGKNPAIKTVLADDAQLHFVSCVVGLGSVGDNFTKGIAALLLQSQGEVETSMNFGLGDWSMPQGMGFWDYQTDSQVSHDNDLYTKNHKDAEIAQKGTIRVVAQNKGSWASSLVGNRDFMSLAFERVVAGPRILETRHVRTSATVPTRIRVPGTNSYVDVELE